MLNTRPTNLETPTISTYSPSATLTASPIERLLQTALLLATADHRSNKRQALTDWINGPVHAVLPHVAMICTHAVEHSFGYEVIQLVSAGVPQAYLDSITTPRNNIHSKIFTRMLLGNSVVYLESNKLAQKDIGCLAEFWQAGYANLVGYTHRTSGECGRISNIIFFNVDKKTAIDGAELNPIIMPSLHTILASMGDTPASGRNPPKFRQQLILTARQRAVAECVVRGKMNKEISRFLDINERTVKYHVGTLMLKLNTANRTALAVVLHQIL